MKNFVSFLLLRKRIQETLGFLRLFQELNFNRTLNREILRSSSSSSSIERS